MTGTKVGGNAVRFFSWNVGGINGTVKRAKVFDHIKKFKPDITFLQETHLRTVDEVRLARPWIGQIFHSKFDTKTRGTAILIRKNVQFVSTNTIADSHGRFIIVVGFLYQTPVVLANIYAPNWDDVNFMKRFLSALPNLNSHRLILAGDLNFFIDNVLDRSSANPAVPLKMSRAFSTFMEQCGCVDPWRFLHPTVKQFSFFSHVHHSYTRIDYFFLDRAFQPFLISANYSTITISDHAPVILDLNFKSKPKEYRVWRLDTTLLSTEEFCSTITQAIDVFLTTNKNSDTSPSLLWETLKANIRGVIISYSAHANKLRLARQRELLALIADIDSRYAIDPTPELYKDRVAFQTEYNLLTTREAEQQLLRARGTLYEHGDKAGRLLAHQLKGRSAAQSIPQIRDHLGSLTTDPDLINKSFMSFYSQLYTSEASENTSEMSEFFFKQTIPQISSEECNSMDQPLRLGEVTSAIKLMQSGKSPGPDGYPVEFFKKFSDSLAPLLLEMFEDSLKKGALPLTLTQASISLLLKKDKDPTNCSSYRPISLLNVDAKILAKILAGRLETVLPTIISEDQTGFIKNRHSFANIRRLLNIVYSHSSDIKPEVVISMDAEKAFDRVEWNYLFLTLEKFGFGEKILAWIRLLYTSPQACVVTNHSRSKYFSLTRGTRQGCPLSPLLFAVAIEPLSIALKDDPVLSGIKRGGVEHRVSLYADDLLLYVSDPLSSIPHIISTLTSFGSFSGYKLNLQKSECFPINDLARKISQALQPLHLATTGFKYLGINITQSFDSLYERNFTALTTKVKAELQRWNNLPLSLAGRVQSVKMNILPRYLYLFQCLPISLPKSFFSKLDSIILTFLWEGKPPRIKLPHLQRGRTEGGLGLPHFLHYYWAANIHKITLWIGEPDHGWCKLEATSCISSSLEALVCSPLPLAPSKYSANPVVVSSLKIWGQIRKACGWPLLGMAAPICNNHLFPAAKLDPGFAIWGREGLTHLRSLYIEGQFGEFQDLRECYNLRQSDQFRYFQIRHFVKAYSPTFPSMPGSSGIEHFLSTVCFNKGAISYLYGKIPGKNLDLVKIKISWETELGLALSDKWWEQATERINSSSSCARLNLIQLKVFYRTHYSRSKLAKMYPNITDNCIRCSQSPGNLSHMFWSCSKLVPFWKSFFEVMSQVLKTTILPTPQTAIFGTPDEGIALTNIQQHVLAFASLIARRRILLHWKANSPPKTRSWLIDLMSFLNLEKIKFTTRGSSDKFYIYWQSLIDYINQLPSLSPG